MPMRPTGSRTSPSAMKKGSRPFAHP
jgi:hypothetical protein